MVFTQRVIIMTGASSGIGAATALHFAKLGGLLTITGRNKDRLQLTADAISAVDGCEPLVLEADLNKDIDVQQIVTKTIEKFGQLDVLVNCAGIYEPGNIQCTTLEQFDRLMQTNIRSMLHLTKLAVPHLIATKGNIVNVSSVCGLRSFPNTLAYNLSKSAVDQLTRCVALELGRKGVRCNSVNPGVILTELLCRGMTEERYIGFLKRARKTHALGRPGGVHEVSSVITFLASNGASFVTGANVPVDGGRHLMCPH